MLARHSWPTVLLLSSGYTGGHTALSSGLQYVHILSWKGRRGALLSSLPGMENVTERPRGPNRSQAVVRVCKAAMQMKQFGNTKPEYWGTRNLWPSSGRLLSAWSLSSILAYLTLQGPVSLCGGLEVPTPNYDLCTVNEEPLGQAPVLAPVRTGAGKGWVLLSQRSLVQWVYSIWELTMGFIYNKSCWRLGTP